MAIANERVQEVVQAGTQGIRKVKVVNITDGLFGGRKNHIDKCADFTVKVEPNESAIDNGFDRTVVLTLTGLVHLGFVFTTLSMGELGLFLFVRFQLA